MIAGITLLLECLICALLCSFLGESISDFTAIFLIFIFTLAYIVTIQRNKILRRFSTPLLIAYCLRLIFLLWDLYGRNIFLLPNSGADTEAYYHHAIAFVNTGVVPQGDYFGQLMGSFFLVIGTNRLFGQFIVVIFSIIAICALVYILHELRDNIKYDLQYRIMCIVSLLPNFAILSSIFLRESIVCMFISLSFYLFVRWLKAGRLMYLLMALGFSMVGAIFHAGSVAVTIGYIVVLFFYNRRREKINLRPSNILLGLFFLLVMTFLYAHYTDTYFAKMAKVTDINDIAGIDTIGGSSYAAYVGDSSNPMNMLLYTPLRMFFFLFSPLPWMWRGPFDLIAFFFSAMFYVTSIYGAYKYLKRPVGENRIQAFIILVVALATAFVFGWGVSNVGTACRHRDKMVIIYATLYALIHDARKDRKLRVGGIRVL